MTSYADLHYRRASQIQAFGNTLYAGAPSGRPNSARSSDDSHVLSSETYHSSEPIVTRSFKNPRGYLNAYTTISAPYPEIKKTPLSPVPELPAFSNTLYPDMIHSGREKAPLPPVPELPAFSNNLYPDVVNAAVRGNAPMNYSRPKPTNPHLRNLKVDMGYLQPPQPIADPSRGSSPSLYPPTLDETEELYWQRQGFERVQPSKQLPSPPDSALGLKFGPHGNASQTSVGRAVTTSDGESEFGLYPHMEPHVGSTAMPLR